MARENNLFRGLTVGLVLILAFAFLFTNANKLFPTRATEYQVAIGVYAVFLAIVFALDSRASERTESPLFTASFFSVQGVVKILLGAGITLLILIPLGLLVKGSALPSVYQAISGVGLGLIAFHALIVAFSEELIFRGRLVNELRDRKVKETAVQWTQSIIFAGFHYGTAGGEPLLLLIYIPLGVIFLYVRDKFSPRTQTANIGVHFGWNLFILGFMQGVL